MDTPTIKELIGQSSLNYYSSNLSVVMNSSSILNQMECNKYYQLVNPEVIFVTAGTAVMEIDFITYALKQGMIMVLPRDTVYSFVSKSDSYTTAVIDINVYMEDKNMPIEESVYVLECSTREEKLFSQYYDLFYKQMELYEGRIDLSIEYLLGSLLEYIRKMIRYHQSEKPEVKNINRLFYDFKHIVKTSDDIVRSREYYAQKLNVTPNHLSKVVKRVSGKSILENINAICLIKAKYLLRFSTLNIGIISHKVGFKNQTSFGRFFYDNMKMTTKEFRNK